MPLTLKAFLSHRYQSPTVNTYFHEVFSEAAELQFDVDVAAGSTNVTRLERMVRDTDAFVGIYPYHGEGVERPTRQQLLEASRYFRLELDLAARARTPSIIFVDQRYGRVMAPPASMFVCLFDHQEVMGRGGSPNRENFRRTFKRFCENVEASMQYERTRPPLVDRSVGILLPPAAYDQATLEDLESRIWAANLEVERLPWPVVLDARMVSQLQAYDWIVGDVGAASADTGLIAYLHGQCLPTLRISRQIADPAGPAPAASPLETTLFGGHQVGYPKDVIRWTTTAQLGEEFDKRLARIVQESRRIGSTQEAEQYFLEAARRKEAVFLSYSGKDEAAVAPIAGALRRHFQSVFDYRDGGDSIEPGRAWIDEIFTKLDRSAVAVPMLSASYIASGNCLHEARSMVAARDSGKLTIVPVKLVREDLTLPPFLTDIQYIRAWEQSDPQSVVDRIVRTLE
jgi:TIR domain